jgi:aldose 1-epimerase
MSIQREIFGRLPDGREASLFRLSASGGMSAAITNFGGIIAEIHVPDRNGKPADVTLGYDKFEHYLRNPPCFGALVGRYANRIANAAFELNGNVYRLYANDGKNHLHGGAEGFHKKLWDARIVSESGQEKLELKYQSRDGEEGYPGTLDVKVLYSLDDSGALSIEYHAVSDKDTIVNLTNHAYFNLSGQGSGDILGHVLTIHAGSYTEINDECIPTGRIAGVQGTPLDFRKPAVVGDGLLREKDCGQLVFGHGYDHNFVLHGYGRGIVKAAEVYDPASGRRMCVFTDKPGIQFYSGNHLDGAIAGKGGAVYARRAGLCLETQHFPDSIHQSQFPSPVLRAGEQYDFTTIYRFSAE